MIIASNTTFHTSDQSVKVEICQLVEQTEIYTVYRVLMECGNKNFNAFLQLGHYGNKWPDDIEVGKFYVLN